MYLVTVIFLSVVLLVVHIFVQSLSSVFGRGWKWTISPRDGDRQPHTVFTGRAARALANYRETLPVFLVLAFLMLWARMPVGYYGLVGAWLWFWARVAYLPLYLSGLPYLRSLVWLVAFAGLVLMGVAVYNVMITISLL